MKLYRLIGIYPYYRLISSKAVLVRRRLICLSEEGLEKPGAPCAIIDNKKIILPHYSVVFDMNNDNNITSVWNLGGKDFLMRKEAVKIRVDKLHAKVYMVWQYYS